MATACRSQVKFLQMLDKEEQIKQKNCMAFSNNLDTKSPKQERISGTITSIEKSSICTETNTCFYYDIKEKVNYSLQPRGCHCNKQISAIR